MTSRTWLILLLGFLSAVGPVSTDMYLPAFPALEVTLHGSAGSAQITLAAWFVGLAFGQMTQGTLSDRYGRRMPLMIGTALYTVASLGCALAPGIPSFSACRVLAAFGGSASMVVPRAIVRDLTDGPAAARMLSRLILIMGVVPILAPGLGGAMLTFASWRFIFWFATVYGALALLLVWRFLPDTLPPQRRLRLGLGGLLARYRTVARENAFITHALQSGLAFGALFAYLGGAPTVFIDEFGFTPAQFGALFGLNAAGYIVGSQVSPRLLPRFGAHRVLRGSIIALGLATLVLTIAAFSGHCGIMLLILPLFVCLASIGTMMPMAVVGALSRHAAQAGSASALMGTLQFGIAAISGTIVGLAGDGTPRAMAALMLGCTAGAIVMDRLRPRL